METRIKVTDSNWWKWGVASKHKAIPDYRRLLRFLQERFDKAFEQTRGHSSYHNCLSDEDNVRFITETFGTALPASSITTDAESRLKRSLGKSYPDLLKIVTSQTIPLPDAVISPRDHMEVVDILKVCSRYNIQVTPFGGGTNVVGALSVNTYETPRVVLDMTRMCGLLRMDQTNHIAVFQTGIFGPEIERLLNTKGFTLGHFPQSFEYSTLGGWIATRSAGQESSAYGKIEDMVVSLKIATPRGTITTSPFEGDAEGVNLKSLFFGSEGMVGVVTEATVGIHLRPKTKRWSVAVFPAFENGLDAIKDLVQKKIFPAVVRYSDGEETTMLSLLKHEERTLSSNVRSWASSALLRFKGIQRPNLLMMRFDGEAAECALKVKIASQIIREHKGFSTGAGPGKQWERSRFDLPYLRDAMIERGIFVDTMETVLPWSEITTLKQTLLTELQHSKAFGYEKGILLAHLSHVYTSSSSIYFTVITAQDEHNPQAQWREIKRIATDIITKCGGALSHHHGIGRDHQPWYLARTDVLTREVLQSVKRTVDPDHILNPGNLFDDPRGVYIESKD